MTISSRHAVIGMRHALSVLMVCLVLAGVSARAAEPVGSVVLATGAVSAVGSDGSVRILAKGSPVYAGDTVTTASKSLCVLNMVDGAKLSVRAESEVQIEDYEFGSAGSDSSVVELVKGGFRAVTGAIGQQNPDAYKVNSSLSVLGIRGTEYLTRLCVATEEGNSCERDIVQIGGERDAVLEGQYVFVTEGGVYMLTELDDGFAELDVAAGRSGYAGENALRLLPEIPDFLRYDPTPAPDTLSDNATPLYDFEGCRI